MRVIEYLLGPGSTLGDVLLAAADLLVVGYLVYRALLLIRGTRALNVLVGIFVVGIGYLGAGWANLLTLHWVLGHFLTYSVIGLIILFQADIRRGLAQLGRGSLLAALAPDDRAAHAGLIEAVVRAAGELSRRRAGALLVLERLGDLSEVVETGVRLDAEVSQEVLLSVFVGNGPLHDGAAVIQRGRLAAASCILPLSTAPARRELGTRHRAALGLAEELDAVVVVVSEERGEISTAVHGSLQRGLDEGALRAALVRLLAPGRRRARGLLGRLVRRPQPREEEDRRAAV